MDFPCLLLVEKFMSAHYNIWQPSTQNGFISGCYIKSVSSKLKSLICVGVVQKCIVESNPCKHLKIYRLMLWTFLKVLTWCRNVYLCRRRHLRKCKRGTASDATNKKTNLPKLEGTTKC